MKIKKELKMKTYYDNFQNKATITKVRVKPYCDAKQKQTGYLFSLVLSRFQAY